MGSRRQRSGSDGKVVELVCGEVLELELPISPAAPESLHAEGNTVPRTTTAETNIETITRIEDEAETDRSIAERTSESMGAEPTTGTNDSSGALPRRGY
jgi:hypothetical protein